MESPQPPQHAGHTRPLEPSSPTVGDRPRKTQRKINHPPTVIPYGEASRTTKTVTSTLQQGIEATVTEARRAERILQDYATQFDHFSAKYTTQKDQLLAEEISKAVGGALINFYQNKFSADRVNDTPRVLHASRHASYADKLKQNTPDKAHFPGPRSSTSTRSAPTKPPPKSREDRRVLVTLPPEALLQREDPYILKRRLLNEVSSLLLTSVMAVTPTRTGWAVLLADVATRDSLISEDNLPRVLKAFGGTNAFIPEHWFTYAVPNVPTSFLSIMNSGETIEVTPQLVSEEVLAQIGESPVRCSMSRHGVNPITRKATWIISFKREVRPFRLFTSACSSHIIDKRAKITHHSTGCQGWCNPLKCLRDTRCNNCGTQVNSHGDSLLNNQCTHPTKCANCFGPHKAGYEKCPAMPRASQGKIIRPTKREIRNIRAASVLIMNAAARTSSSSPEDTAIQGTQTDSPPGGVPVRRSASPSPIARKRGQAVEEHERRGAAAKTPATASRPTRITKNTGSLNIRDLSRKSRTDWPTVGTHTSGSPELSQSSQCSSNPFSILNRDPQGNSGMDVDASDNGSS